MEALCDAIIAWPEVAGSDGDDKFANYAVGLVKEVAKVTGKDRLSKIQVVRCWIRRMGLALARCCMISC